MITGNALTLKNSEDFTFKHVQNHFIIGNESQDFLVHSAGALDQIIPQPHQRSATSRRIIAQGSRPRHTDHDSTTMKRGNECHLIIGLQHIV